VAHPTRLALVGLLRREGPLTATQAGERLGESAASCSFHLRQLAKYGLVEEAGGGRGRERPWKATALFTDWPNVGGDPDMDAASQLLDAVVAERYFEQLMRWLEQQRGGEPAEWREAALFGDTLVYLTVAELQELGRRIRALIDPYVDRLPHADRRPPRSRLVTVLHVAFPTPPDRPPEA
jgi:DNA-binding transcriptional ArsR family regulator